MTTSYNAQAIEVLKGLEPVQRRPGMYTNTVNPNHLAQEVIDNSVDEALAGFADKIHITLHKDGSLSVTDNGRGMPVDYHPEHEVTGVELILTKLHAGAKFSNKSYHFSGGLHGVGVSVVNALSRQLQVDIYQNGQHFQMAFAHGQKTSELTYIDQVSVKRSGSSIRFWPSDQYFDSPQFQLTTLTHLLRAKAVLCAGLVITLTDEPNNQNWRWCYQNGPSEYLETMLAEEPFTPQPCFHGNHDSESESVTWAVAWSNERSAFINESYVNLIPTPLGGTHVNGLKQGLLEAVREFCDFHNLLPKNLKLTTDDLFHQCNFVLSVKMTEPQLAGQTKERLASRRTAGFVSSAVKDAFSLWLNRHVETAQNLVQLFIDNAQKRQRESQKVTRKKVTSGPALPGKLADCTTDEPEQCELFLVEGDSAGGSAKQARDREFQAVMPLKGKILNTWEIDPHRVLASQEIHDIAVALGVDPGTTELSGLRYDKVCVLADADSDGQHIAALLCALFVRHFPALVSAGHVYIAMPPLYRIEQGQQVYYALDDDEKTTIIHQLQNTNKRGQINVVRFKGLGEMNPSQLRETTMAPQSRRLTQLTLEDSEATQQVMDMLLSKRRAKDRRQWLHEKGDLADVLV